MRNAALVFVTVCWLAACGAAGGAAGTPVRSGIAGKVVEGPTCPVESVPPQPQCAPRPLAATLRISAPGGSHVRTVHSGADGRFKLALRPGTYLVTPEPKAGSPFPRPPAAEQVRVRPGRYTRITVTYDTGIR